LAVAAVAGKKTTAWIRAHSGDFVQSSPRVTENLDATRMKQRALDAVSQGGAMKQIRLVSVNTIAAPLPTPRPHARLTSDHLEQLYAFAKSAAKEAVHEAGRNETEREHGR
jgi:hypothetical protein